MTRRKYYQEMIHLSERQLELLNSCLYGIKHLNDVQINALSPLEKKIIERRYFKTQKVLNRLKQKEVNKRCKYFAKVFYNSPVKKLFDSNLLSNKHTSISIIQATKARQPVLIQK